MLRRDYLAAAGMTFSAGCTQGQNQGETTTTVPETDTPTPTPSPSPTPEPTPTSTPEPPAPSIESFSLVTKWEGFGDAIENQLEAAGSGSLIVIADRYELFIQDNTFDILKQYRVRDANGSRVAIEQFEDSQLTDRNGLQTWEGAMRFDTDSWPGTGTYEAELIIRDNALGKTSEPITSDFRLTDPLSPTGLSVSNVEHPDVVKVDEEFEIEVTLENQSSRDGTFLSPMSYSPQGTSQWYTYSDFTLEIHVQSGGQGSGGGTGFYFTQPGTYTQRIDELDYTWSIEVE